MHKLMMASVLFSNAAFAHDGHGALPVHFHGWEVTLLVAVCAGVALYLARK